MSKMAEEDKKRWEDQSLEWSSPKYWRAWGSWFGWGSPVGLGLFFVELAAAVWILTQAF